MNVNCTRLKILTKRTHDDGGGDDDGDGDVQILMDFVLLDSASAGSRNDDCNY